MPSTYCPTCDSRMTPQPSMADTPEYTEACAPCARGDGKASLYRRDEPEGSEWIKMNGDVFPATALLRGHEYRLESSDRHKAVYIRD